jgi:hypothetical protein
VSRFLIAATVLALPLLAGRPGLAAPKPSAGAKAAPVAQTSIAPKRLEIAPPDFGQLARLAVEKSLPLLQSSSATFIANRQCFSCHHQGLTMMTVGLARERGFKVNETLAQAQTQDLNAQVGGLKELLRAAEQDKAAERKIDFFMVDPSISVGYVMAGLKADRHTPDEVTALAAGYLARKQADDGHWPLLTARPPHESSEFCTTALGILALRTFGPTEEAATARAIARGRNWLASAPAKTTEDLSFRLLGLAWANAGPEELRKATDALLAEQRDDGGWGQIPGRASDAYATGQALVALRQGGMATTEPAFMRGFVNLILTQKPDGSWLVPTRTNPAQPYFESGFPHGKSQFISCAGSAWATMALLYVAQPAPAKTTAFVPTAKP